MVTRHSNNGAKVAIFVSFFLVMFLGVFLGVQFITKTGIFRIPGVVYYDESLSSDERAKLEEIFAYQTDLDKDVTISARNSLESPELNEGEYVYNIYVPVTDFYSTETNIDTNSLEEIYDTNFQAEHKFELIPISELDFTKKLLSLNNKYYLDEFTTGGVYRIVSFVSDKFNEEIKPLVTNSFTVKAPTKDTTLTFAQTGVTALSRGMNARLNAVGGDATYFAEGIKDFLSNFDITHTSNESSFTDFASSSNI